MEKTSELPQEQTPFPESVFDDHTLVLAIQANWVVDLDGNAECVKDARHALLAGDPEPFKRIVAEEIESMVFGSGEDDSLAMDIDRIALIEERVDGETVLQGDVVLWEWNSRGTHTSPGSPGSETETPKR